MNNAQFDLIVVGAGILGLSAAIQAQEQGLKVCIFEKNAKPVGQLVVISAWLELRH
jgi:flavin-dependent dehydrogenase